MYIVWDYNFEQKQTSEIEKERVQKEDGIE